MCGDGKVCKQEPPRSQQGPDGLCHAQEARGSGRRTAFWHRVTCRAAAGASWVWCDRERWLCPCWPGFRAARLLPPVGPSLGTCCGRSGFAGFSCCALCGLSAFRQTTLSHFEIMNIRCNLIFLFLLWVLLFLLKCDVLHSLFFLYFLVESALK